MSGIYIHIPFCKQKCNYCDFFSVVSKKNIKNYLQAILIEIELQKNFLNKEIETIYFGGGTPSILSVYDINKILEKIEKNFILNDNVEITLEANPENLNKNYLKNLKSTKINRLSIGIQSFNDEDLIFLNRKHKKKDSIISIKNAQNLGFENISIDLIYGIPNMNLGRFLENLNIFFNLKLQHLSAYSLEFEEKTILYRLLKKNIIKKVSEEKSLQFFKLLVKKAIENNFIHYEISNFGKKNFFSIHNSNYWKNKKYLGIGVSAHSYNKIYRKWNISNISKYIDSIKNKNEIISEKEILDKKTKYNDYILTSLRTIWGIDLISIENNFGIFFKKYCLKNSQKFIKKNFLIKKNNKITFSEKGKFIIDGIISDLFFV